MPQRRGDYVRALQAERDAITARPVLNQARLTAIDAELDRFRDAPARPAVERAVTSPEGPISRSRKRGAGA